MKQKNGGPGRALIDFCPSCGRSWFFGIPLSARQALVLKRIMRARDEGIPAAAFAMPANLLKQHVYQINCKLEETDFVIRGENGRHDSRWRLVRRQ